MLESDKLHFHTHARDKTHKHMNSYVQGLGLKKRIKAAQNVLNVVIHLCSFTFFTSRWISYTLHYLIVACSAI